MFLYRWRSCGLAVMKRPGSRRQYRTSRNRPLQPVMDSSTLWNWSAVTALWWHLICRTDNGVLISSVSLWLGNYIYELCRVIALWCHFLKDYSYNIVQCSDFKCFFMIGELQIGDLYRTDPLGLQLSVEYWCPQDNYGPHETTYNVRPPQRQVLVHLTHLKSKERKYTICLCIHVHFHCNGRKS